MGNLFQWFGTCDGKNNTLRLARHKNYSLLGKDMPIILFLTTTMYWEGIVYSVPLSVCIHPSIAENVTFFHLFIQAVLYFV